MYKILSIILDGIIDINLFQLKQLRSLYKSEKGKRPFHLDHNFRAPQPLNSRKVKYHDLARDCKCESSNATSITSTTTTDSSANAFIVTTITTTYDDGQVKMETAVFPPPPTKQAPSLQQTSGGCQHELKSFLVVVLFLFKWLFIS